jgi:signal peptidase I
MSTNETMTPSVKELEKELVREKDRNRFLKAVRSVLNSLIVVAAAAVIVAMLVLPVIQIQGTSMTNTLQDKDIVVALRGSNYQTGDVTGVMDGKIDEFIKAYLMQFGAEA